MASEKLSKKGKGKGKGIKDEGELSLDEISSLRQNAQQKSIDAVKGLEDRYQKAKEKDTLPDNTHQAEKTGDVKGATVGTVQKSEKTVAAAKDTVAGYTGKVAVDAKDRAVVAGLGVAEYTTEKTLQATKATADVVGGVASYVGEKAGVAKDAVMGYVGEKVVAAKDAVVSAEETAAAYTARKKGEAERQMEENKRAGGGNQDSKVVVGEGSQCGGGNEVIWDEEMRAEEKGGDGGLLQAIGETLVEIAQTAKNLLIGSGESGQGNDNSYEKKE